MEVFTPNKLLHVPVKMGTVSSNSKFPIFAETEPVLVLLKDVTLRADSLSVDENDVLILRENLRLLAENAKGKLNMNLEDFIYVEPQLRGEKERVKVFNRENCVTSLPSSASSVKADVVVNVDNLHIDYTYLQLTWDIDIVQIRVNEVQRLPRQCLLDTSQLDEESVIFS